MPRGDSIKSGEFAVMFFGGFDICEASVTELVEATQVEGLVVDMDAGAPFPASLAPRHALETGGAVRAAFPVSAVLQCGSFAQIQPAVVVADAVDVVDFRL
jgi:hypothetical protein